MKLRERLAAAMPILVTALILIPRGTITAAESNQSRIISYAKEVRNRAAVLLVGEMLTPTVAEYLQAHWADQASFFRPATIGPTAASANAVIEECFKVRPWHVVVLCLAPGAQDADDFARTLQAIVHSLQARNVPVVWCSYPKQNDEAATVLANDAARRAMRAEGSEVADLYGALLTLGPRARGTSGELSALAIERIGSEVSRPLQHALFSRSSRWAELPPGETRDPSRLLLDPELLSSPMELSQAKGKHALVYRAEQSGWQFNLHSFIAHHDGKFWAVWSSGRIDEDSRSQLIRYATSVDGLHWSDSRVLAPDPDGETGAWRWMASGIYVEGGRLLALGSLNRGNEPPGGPWADARLVRFGWTGSDWREERVVREGGVVYFPPLRIEGRDFFVWRDTRALIYTALAPAGTDRFEISRLPGPLPDYRMSETSAYVDPQGIVHLIIRDQGYTRRLYHTISYDAGGTWTIPVKTNYPDAASKNMAGRLSNGWYYLISNPKALGENPRDPLVITFSRDGWTFSHPLALRKHAPALRFKGGAKGSHSFQYSHAIEHDGKLWVIYATNKEDIEVSSYPIEEFGLTTEGG